MDCKLEVSVTPSAGLIMYLNRSEDSGKLVSSLHYCFLLQAILKDMNQQLDEETHRARSPARGLLFWSLKPGTVP